MGISNCDWPDCLESATHRVEVVYSDGRTEARLLCRDHDNAWKAKVRKEVGPKPADPPRPTVPATLACGECGRVLEEPQGLAVELRKPCPDCGSTRRQVRVTAEDHVEMHEAVAITGTPAGKPKNKW